MLRPRELPSLSDRILGQRYVNGAEAPFQGLGTGRSPQTSVRRAPRPSCGRTLTSLNSGAGSTVEKAIKCSATKRRDCLHLNGWCGGLLPISAFCRAIHPMPHWCLSQMLATLKKHFRLTVLGNQKSPPTPWLLSVRQSNWPRASQKRCIKRFHDPVRPGG